MVSTLVENSPSTSVSFTVIGKEPETVGVPVMAPVSRLNESP